MHELTFQCILSKNMKKQALKYNTSIVIFSHKNYLINLLSTHCTLDFFLYMCKLLFTLVSRVSSFTICLSEYTNIQNK